MKRAGLRQGSCGGEAATAANKRYAYPPEHWPPRFAGRPFFTFGSRSRVARSLPTEKLILRPGCANRGP